MGGGRLAEFNSFYDKVKQDDPGVDMFMAGWMLSSEPSPAALHGERAPSNYTRFVTPENTRIMDAMDSEKLFDHKYRVEQFHKWQEYMFDQAYVVPTTNNYSIYAVNSKITGNSLKPSENNNGHQLWYQVGYVN